MTFQALYQALYNKTSCAIERRAASAFLNDMHADQYAAWIAYRDAELDAKRAQQHAEG